MEKVVLPYFNGVLETVSDMFRILFNQNPPTIEVVMTNGIVSFDIESDRNKIKHMVLAAVRAQEQGSVIPTKYWQFAKLLNLASGVFSEYAESLYIGYITAAVVEENFEHYEKETVKAVALLTPLINRKRSDGDLDTEFRVTLRDMLISCGYVNNENLCWLFDTAIIGEEPTNTIRPKRLLWQVLRVCNVVAVIEYMMPKNYKYNTQKISIAALFATLETALGVDMGEIHFGSGQYHNHFRACIETSKIYQKAKKIADEIYK